MPKSENTTSRGNSTSGSARPRSSTAMGRASAGLGLDHVGLVAIGSAGRSMSGWVAARSGPQAGRRRIGFLAKPMLGRCYDDEVDHLPTHCYCYVATQNAMALCNKAEQKQIVAKRLIVALPNGVRKRCERKRVKIRRCELRTRQYS